MSEARFWESKQLNEMTTAQWESLCDGCGKCCLHKLEDEDTHDVYYTDVSCQYLDLDSCSCKNYSKRLQLAPMCVRMDSDKVAEYKWLPSTCAYRRLAEGKPLYDWHPLISGHSSSVHDAGMSVRHRVIPESDIEEDEWEERVIHWVI